MCDKNIIISSSTNVNAFSLFLTCLCLTIPKKMPTVMFWPQSSLLYPLQMLSFIIQTLASMHLPMTQMQFIKLFLFYELQSFWSITIFFYSHCSFYQDIPQFSQTHLIWTLIPPTLEVIVASSNSSELQVLFFCLTSFNNSETNCLY